MAGSSDSYCNCSGKAGHTQVVEFVPQVFQIDNVGNWNSSNVAGNPFDFLDHNIELETRYDSAGQPMKSVGRQKYVFRWTCDHCVSENWYYDLRIGIDRRDDEGFQVVAFRDVLDHGACDLRRKNGAEDELQDKPEGEHASVGHTHCGLS